MDVSSTPAPPICNGWINITIRNADDVAQWAENAEAIIAREHDTHGFDYNPADVDIPSLVLCDQGTEVTAMTHSSTAAASSLPAVLTMFSYDPEQFSLSTLADFEDENS